MQFLVICGIFCLLMALWRLTLFFSEKAILKRKFKKFSTGNTLTAKDGDHLRFKGNAQIHLSSLSAPLSNRKCVYYKVIVEERTSGKNNSWRTIIHDEKAVDFFLKMGDKKILVSTRNVRNHLIKDHNKQSGFLNDPSPFLQDYVKRHGYSTTNFLGFNNTLRYHEGIIEIEELVVAAGCIKWKTASELNIKDGPEKILYLKAPNGQHLLLSDDPELM